MRNEAMIVKMRRQRKLVKERKREPKKLQLEGYPAPAAPVQPPVVGVDLGGNDYEPTVIQKIPTADSILNPAKSEEASPLPPNVTKIIEDVRRVDPGAAEWLVESVANLGTYQPRATSLSSLMLFIETQQGQRFWQGVVRSLRGKDEL